VPAKGRLYSHLHCTPASNAAAAEADKLLTDFLRLIVSAYQEDSGVQVKL
jgi:hypothetical protein